MLIYRQIKEWYIELNGRWKRAVAVWWDDSLRWEYEDLQQVKPIGLMEMGMWKLKAEKLITSNLSETVNCTLILLTQMFHWWEHRMPRVEDPNSWVTSSFTSLTTPPGLLPLSGLHHAATRTAVLHASYHSSPDPEPQSEQKTAEKRGEVTLFNC